MALTQPTRAGTILRATFKSGEYRSDPGLHHFDSRYAEYTSEKFATVCNRLGVIQSMGRVGCALDNAVAEATFSTLKVEYIHRRWFATRAEARLKIATRIVDFYNLRRRHSACDGQSPIDYERSTTAAQETLAA